MDNWVVGFILLVISLAAFGLILFAILAGWPKRGRLPSKQMANKDIQNAVTAIAFYTGRAATARQNSDGSVTITILPESGT